VLGWDSTLVTALRPGRGPTRACQRQAPDIYNSAIIRLSNGALLSRWRHWCPNLANQADRQQSIRHRGMSDQTLAYNSGSSGSVAWQAMPRRRWRRGSCWDTAAAGMGQVDWGILLVLYVELGMTYVVDVIVNDVWCMLIGWWPVIISMYAFVWCMMYDVAMYAVLYALCWHAFRMLCYFSSQ
jgi:hypothetical protein